MKLPLTLLLIAVVFARAFTQNIVQAEYFIDTDLGVGKNKLLAVTASPDGNFSFNVNVSSVNTGYHKLYIRTKDSNGKWSFTARRNLEIISSENKKTISSGEYFFDMDPGYGSATSITIAPQDSMVMQKFTALVTGLQPGYHKLYARFKDNQGNWSHTLRRNVELIKSPDSNFIKSVEYFIGSDPGVGLATKLDVSSVVDNSSNTFKIPLTCIKVDSNNNIYLRVLDAKGNWSLTAYNTFKLTDKGIVTNIKQGLWSDASTWSNGKIPDANTPIYLDYNIIVDVNAVCKFLNTQCHDVKVNAGIVLQVKGVE